MSWNPAHIFLLLFSTIITYISAILIERLKNNNGTGKVVLIMCIVLNLGLLFYYKYLNFVLTTVNYALGNFGINISFDSYDILLPVGISFYTFQALGYVIDVYRKNIYAEKNILKYALFVSFFPQLVAGPIERSKNLLKQLASPKKFDYDKAREGLFLMLWGFFLKIVIADRIAVFVDTVYKDYDTYPGYFLMVATILFAIQIYTDFHGYSTIAIGAARMIGINLIENFNAPYISTSVTGFWHKWHISLTSWFTDYVYIPLGGNRKGKIRKYFNKIVVFLISGLWHGADGSFVIWGGINGLYLVFEEITKPVRDLFVRVFQLNRKTIGHKIASAVITFILVDFAWIFFRANTTNDAINIIKSIFTVRNTWILFDGSLYTCGLDQQNFQLMILGIILLFAVDIFRVKEISVSEIIIKQDYWCRWLVLVIAIVSLLVFGIWGSSYDAASFIYFQF